MSAYALWRRALARVDRRARTYLAVRPMSGATMHCRTCEAALARLGEAVRLANRLAPAKRYGR